MERLKKARADVKDQRSFRIDNLMIAPAVRKRKGQQDEDPAALCSPFMGISGSAPARVANGLHRPRNRMK